MGYTNFVIWAGKQGFKYGQKYLFKAWKEAEKLGKPIAEKHFPKLINKAKDYYKNFKTFDPKVVPKEIVKPKRFKWDDAGPGSAFDKRLRAIVDKHKAQIKPENLNAANTSRFVTGAKEGITGIKPPGFNPSVIKGGKKAEGGIMTASYGYDDAMAESRSAYEDALKKGTIPLDMEFEEFLDISNESYAQGGRANFDDGGPSQKDIDKGLKAIEKLKSSLMPESYEELIEIYKDKQKDLNIDIMESAGGLGDMLGEGGRAEFDAGGLAEKWNIIRDLYNQVGGQEGTGMSIEEFALQYEMRAEGGRVGMMYGGDPGFAFSYGGSWADWKENHASEMPVMDYINQKLPKARNPFTDTRYEEGGPVKPMTPEEFSQLLFQKPYNQLKPSEQQQVDGFTPSKAEGGRIGLANGTTMDAFDSMTPNRKYMMTGESDVHRIMPPMGGILPLAGAGIFALSQKDKDKKTPQKTEGPNFPEPKPPFKIGDLIIDFIVANSRQPKPSEIGRLKEMLRVAAEKITPTQRMKDQGVEGDFSDYEYTGDETTEDLYRFEEEGTIKRDDWNVFSPRYDEYLDAQIINKHGLYTVKEWENTPDTIKNKTRAQINPDWAEARFGEDWHEVLDKQRTNEIKQTEMFEDFDVKGRTKNATGGRIGFQEGTGIMSQTGIPYYADKAVEGVVNSAETLSKLPFAAGKLGSQLLQSPPDKKMFTDALENITPGSWSENLGISSLAEAEGAKVSGKQRVIGDVLGLGTEMAVPVGGAFKIGQKIIDQASKVIGKLKKGKTLDQTINDKITDFGQSRRDFNATVAASGLMVALKGIGLGGLFKAAPTKDFAVKLKTYFHNSDVDYGTSGMATFDLTALTAPVRTALKSIMNKAQKFKHGNYGEKLSGKEYINMDPGDAKFIVKELQKKGFTGKFTGIADEGGDVLKQAEKAGQKDFVKTYKKQSMKQNVKDHQLYNDYVVYENDPGFLHWNEATKGKLNKPFVSTIDEVVEILEPVVKKGEGGIIEDDEFREFLDDRKNRDKDNFQRDFFEDFKKWKKWKEGNIQEAKDGGRMWQPKSAPQLTTTIPPESGPMPHGLTYLTGDDIVQNIGHKHGRN